MPFLPIVEREMRVGSRRHQTYTGRLAIALPAIVVGGFLYLANLKSPASVLGHRTFVGLSALSMFYCLIAGRRFTADSLSEEKREGTLGLLFLTDLKGYDVVWGKLVATSLNGFYGLLSILPVLAMPLLLGGVTNAEFWRVVLVLVNTFVFSLAIGLLASVVSRDARKAYGLNFLFWIIAMLPAAIGLAICYATSGGVFIHELFYTCPIYSLFLAFDMFHRGHVANFGYSVLLVHLLIWALIARASRIAPRSWQDLPEPAPKTKKRVRDRWKEWIYGNSAQRQALRRRLLGVNAFYWLASRMRLKPLVVWGFLAFMACWWVYMLFALKYDWLDEILFGATVAILNSILKLWIAIETPQRLAEDQKLGALELLLSTPLSVRDIVRGQWLALRRQFLFPILAVVAIELLMMQAAEIHAARTTIREIGITSLVLLAADIAAVFWTGITMGLTAKNPNQAVVRTVLRVLTLPWILFALIAVVVNIIAVANSMPPPPFRFFLNLWFGLGLAVDIAFGLPAWWRVSLSFRELALKRFSVTRVDAAH